MITTLYYTLSKCSRVSFLAEECAICIAGIVSYGLAVEPSTGILFVPDWNEGTIKALDFDKRSWRTVVRDVSSPWAVVVDSNSG